ncbi:MAG TPA: hypothetical protein VKB80_18485 [Kofleriaceae bacterium]|nr:hypothetical protein [Kofleriaceae bacterium]
MSRLPRGKDHVLDQAGAVIADEPAAAASIALDALAALTRC